MSSQHTDAYPYVPLPTNNSLRSNPPACSTIWLSRICWSFRREGRRLRSELPSQDFRSNSLSLCALYETQNKTRLSLISYELRFARAQRKHLTSSWRRHIFEICRIIETQTSSDSQRYSRRSQIQTASRYFFDWSLAACLGRSTIWRRVQPRVSGILPGTWRLCLPPSPITSRSFARQGSSGWNDEGRRSNAGLTQKFFRTSPSSFLGPCPPDSFFGKAFDICRIIEGRKRNAG